MKKFFSVLILSLILTSTSSAGVKKGKGDVILDKYSLENFITYMANFQLKSGFSKFYHTHRKFIGKTREYYTDNYQYDSEISHIFVDDDRTVCIKEAMKDLDPFERMLVEERILKGLRYKEIAENYNIPYPSIRDGLKKTLIKIKDRCQHLSKYLWY